MFYIAEQFEIGKYIGQLVDEQFESQNTFCKAWLEKENIEITNKKELRKKANKFSQIKKGNKWIQTKDLLIFSTLLDVSCEEILSAGKNHIPRINRLTNDMVAHSYDQQIWNEYIQNKNEPILNQDEYGKTVIDYAMDCQNHEFIEFLIDEGYIFLSDKDNQFFHLNYGFWIETKIKDMNYSSRHLNCYDRLLNGVMARQKFIILAMEKNNLNILKELKAREIPDYYDMCFFDFSYQLMSKKNCPIENDQDIYEYYKKNILENIIYSSKEIVEYFTESFQVYVNELEYEYTYYYLSELLNVLVENNHRYVKIALKNASQYSKKTYELIKKQIREYINSIKKQYPLYTLTEIKSNIDKNLSFDKSIVRVIDYHGSQNVIRNLIYVNAQSKDHTINCLINELNDYYFKTIDVINELLKETA